MLFSLEIKAMLEVSKYKSLSRPICTFNELHQKLKGVEFS